MSLKSSYVLIELSGTTSSMTIKAVSSWEYNSTNTTIEEDNSWTTKWLRINNTALEWTSTEGDASSFLIADANDLLNIEVAASDDFEYIGICMVMIETTVTRNGKSGAF